MTVKRPTLTEILDGFAAGDDGIVDVELYEATIQNAAESIGFRWYAAF